MIAAARRDMGLDPEQFARAAAEDVGKSSVDILTSEVLPLLAAMRFLERSAEGILRPRRLGRKGLPLWLTGVDSEVQRVPFGTMLVIGPSNYPLMLAGIQAVQALVAGNTVVWKPGRGGRSIAEALAKVLKRAGLPDGLLRVTDESVAAAERELAGDVDKVFFTGSVPSGRAVLRQAAERVIPCVVELSGCDALIVLPGADLSRVVRALTFGMRLNGSSTCMAPRRVLLVGATETVKAQLVERLLEAFGTVETIGLAPSTCERLGVLLEESAALGGRVHGAMADGRMRPILVVDGSPAMGIAREDIFAPVLTLITLATTDDVVAAQAENPFGLTASIFGKEAECRALAERLEVGSVFINDVIVPSADPRLPFGGRRFSGFGVTQGAEGLLEMTAVKTVSVRRTKSTWHFDQLTKHHETLFMGFIQATYAGRWAERLRGLRESVRAGRHLR